MKRVGTFGDYGLNMCCSDIMMNLCMREQPIDSQKETNEYKSIIDDADASCFGRPDSRR